ncbi:MAG: phage tail sheath C-terminal domain-containing protein, partial [Terracoccus sp.]
EELVTQIQTALVIKADTEPLLKGATVQLVGTSIQLRPGATDPNVSVKVAGTSAATLGLDGAGARNVAAYGPGLGATALAQIQGVAGNNGTVPGSANLRGNQLDKTGLYALEDVDIFNLLVIPEATLGSGRIDVLTEALSYCQQRRAFMIIDVPENTSSFDQAQQWAGSSASPLRSRNSGLFFPRLRMPDPLNPSIQGTYGAAGALAGLFARTDAERGVWKAPAGTTATIVGATGLSYTLNDRENGTLNPLAINCLRTFPVIGTVGWGARTGRGADALADEYKYIPVRRLALFLEESLYRGTQWAVFEPNDEPLWAQIRLNLGAFMHTLFAQGAFQGKTPRDAYFVKCDKETTTQNDIDLGRVNIVVGFAPLKPAEFVVIQIQQIAGAIQT